MTPPSSRPRVSYGAGTKKIREDAGLINYLMRHRHTSPFEMCELKLHAKMPIFVAREWVRHRVANLNETSARYSILDNEFYLPEPEQLGTQSRTNRQGRGETLTGDESARVLEILREDAARAYAHYEEMLNENTAGETIDPAKAGLARELARMNLSVNFYTQWYWKIDLHNLLHFLNLRTDPRAQYEIRVYADAILDVVKTWVPLTYAAFMDYRMGAYELSAKGLAVVRRLLRGEQVDRSPPACRPASGESSWRRWSAEHRPRRIPLGSAPRVARVSRRPSAEAEAAHRRPRHARAAWGVRSCERGRARPA